MPSGAAGQTLAGIMGLTATEQQRIVRWNGIRRQDETV